MKNVIHKIFSNECDESVHNEFVKFSRGVFEKRYLLSGKKQKDKWNIKSSNEFANFFVKYLANKLGNNSAEVKGIIVSTRNLKEIEGFNKTLAKAPVKQFMGIKQFQINQKLTGKEILTLIEASPLSFFALSFDVGENELKIKPKPPKSAKPSTSTKNEENELKIDFCSLKTSDKELIKDLFFDYPDFNEITIQHNIEIKEIEIPKGIEDPAKMRELAKRKGVIKRFVEVNGKKEIKEKNFVV